MTANALADLKYKHDGLELRAARWGTSGPPVMLVHGLMANARFFGALADTCLAERCQLVAPDLRGRGLSDKPDQGYSIRRQAADLIACLDAWGVQQAVLAGHSFGGLLSLYVAANHPERVAGLVLIDTPGPRVHNPLIMPMLAPSMGRLGSTVRSMQEHLEAARKLPYLNGMWDRHIEAYFRADVEQLPDGRVKVRTPRHAILATVTAVASEPWLVHTRRAGKKPSLLLHAPESFGPAGYPPVILPMQTRDLYSLMLDCECQRVEGNHVTMLFGQGATQAGRRIADFADSL